MRPLTLHVSALSDSEYDLYTTSFADLVTDAPNGNGNVPHIRDDAQYERTSVGAREARAWLRGRYSDIPASDIDAILKFFCPNMLPSDTLTGGQFFAAHRLVMHAKSGRGVDRTLAFVQACLSQAHIASLAPASTTHLSQLLSHSKRPVQAPPSHPDRQKLLSFTTSSPGTNPFIRRSTEHVPAAPPPPDPDAASAVPQQHGGKLSHNPFLVRDKPDIDSEKPLPSPNSQNHNKLPPLPPRKPSLLAAPRRSSDAVPTPSAPIISAKPSHVMSPIMRQSLEASKHAQSLKRAEELLDRERVLQVLKTSSSGSSTSNAARTRSLSPSKQIPKPPDGYGAGSGSRSGASDDVTYVPPLPRRRKPSMPSSASSSALSLEQVASASLPTSTSSPSRPPLPSRDVLTISTTHTDNTGLPAVAGPGPIPPPTHPYRRPSTSAATEPTVNDSQPSSPSSPRFSRSKPIASPPPVPPPPRRKRPESMQLTPTSDVGDVPSFPPAWTLHGRTASFQGLSRHLSLTRDRDREPSESSPMAHIQKTLTNLQSKAQPKLDAVRYKAEAGISKRGYIHHTQLGGIRWREEGEQGLMTDTRWAAANVDQDPDSGPTTDDEPSLGEGRATQSATKTTRRSRDLLAESDNLKWPMGEGWKPL